MDKVTSPDLRVVPSPGQFPYASSSISFQLRGQLGATDPRVQASARNLRWQSKTNLIRPKDTLNLFTETQASKENMDQLNQAGVRRGAMDFPSYDVFQKSQNVFTQLNQELSREIEKKGHFERLLSKIPMKLRSHKVGLTRTWSARSRRRPRSRCVRTTSPSSRES